MFEKFQCEILHNFEQTEKIQKEWDQLVRESGHQHPFTSYEWFRCWYKAFCNTKSVRIILIKDDTKLRAIFPGMLINIKKGGILLQCFSLAANGHSPRCELLARDKDHEAIKAALHSPFSKLDKKIDIVVLPSIYENSNISTILQSSGLPDASLFIENIFESPAYDITNGWESYLLSRGKEFRKRFRKSLRLANDSGGYSFDVITLKDNIDETIERLKKIDSKTWQYHNRSGLFSNTENSIFYESLVRNYSNHFPVILCFLKIGDNDVAFELATTFNSTAFCLKYGFDPKYDKYHPGALIQSLLSEYTVTKGLMEIDLVGEMTNEKARWETHKRKHYNYWLINKNNLKCLFLLKLFNIHKSIKKARMLFKIKERIIT